MLDPTSNGSTFSAEEAVGAANKELAVRVIRAKIEVKISFMGSPQLVFFNKFQNHLKEIFADVFHKDFI